MKNGNFVAKYDWRVNKAKVFKDRKKAMKRGESKYKTIKVEKGYSNDTKGYSNDTKGYSNDTKGYSNDTKGYSNDTKGSYKLPFKFFNLF